MARRLLRERTRLRPPAYERATDDPAGAAPIEQSDASPLEHALAAASVERLRVGPLSTGALQAVFRERLTASSRD